MLALIGLGGTWAIAGIDVFPGWLKSPFSQLSSVVEQALPKRPEPQPPVVVAATEPAPQSAADPLPPVQPAAPAKLADASAGTPPRPEDPAPAALPAAAIPYAQSPAPPAPRGHPLQKRAEAVGLHPDLSRVLLERLTATDYRNAGIAIRTATAETPDGEVYVWPRKPKPDLALFQVQFVAGAAPDCRRYVVTVILNDGWSTTALPMEKCGQSAPKPRSE